MQVNRCVSCMEETESYPCPRCGFDANAQPQPEYALPRNIILCGKYLVGKVLGQGGFGITYAGWDLALEMKVAIKEYYPAGQVVRQSSMGSKLLWSGTAQSESARKTGMESFLKEARKMARVDRVPQVVRVRDTFHENDTAYIVMDFVEGETLKARLEREGPLPFDQAMDIFWPALTAMEEVHKAGLIHRDLSPDNIMLEPNGGVRILDLGAAKDLVINRGPSSMLVVKGGFSPFEQYSQQGGSGPWTDVYAMAATIYYTLTGILPPNAIDRLDDDELRWDLPVLQALPAPTCGALQKSMAVLAKNRTQTMDELLAGLEQAKPKPAPKPQPKPKLTPEPKLVPEPTSQPKLTPQPEQKPEPATTPKPKSMSRKKLLGIAGVCAAVLVVVIMAWVQQNNPSSIANRYGDVGPTVTPAPTQEPTPTPMPENVIASGEAGRSVTWTLDSKGVLTISGSGAMDAFFTNAPWESLKDHITSVVVGPGVTNIGKCAFEGCSSLTSITLPEDLTKIDESAFEDCSSLTSITLSEGLTEIGADAFWNCSSLTSVTLPEGVTKIDHHAFGNCSNLISITLPKSVTKIGLYALYGCASLNDVYYDGAEEQWRSIEIGGKNYGLLNAAIHFSSVGPTSASKSVVASGEAGPSATWMLDNKGVLTISGSGEMYDCAPPSWMDNFSAWESRKGQITSVVVEPGVVGIGENAFEGCISLTSVTLPEGMTYIDNEAFSGCTSLTRIVLPESMYAIGRNAFNSCRNLTSITLPKGLGVIGGWAFLYCENLTDVYYGGTEEQWRSINIDGYNDDLLNATIHFGSAAPASAPEPEPAPTPEPTSEPTPAPTSASNGVVASGKAGSTVTWTLDSKGVLTISGSGEIDYTDSPWADYKNKITTLVVKPGITKIGKWAFSSCTSLTSITLPKGVTQIGGFAFYECTSLTSIILPEGLTQIDTSAFAKCTRLTSIILPRSLSKIESYIFKGCTSLTSITLPESLTRIQGYVFSGCTNLTSVSIPAGLQKIESRAFHECASLTDIYYGGTEKQWRNVDIGWLSDELRNATIHYNS